MRNLSKTIDRILKIEPTLQDQLLPIKIKWDQGSRKTLRWKQLMAILNDQIPVSHPKRQDIQNIFILKRKVAKKLYTFEPPSPAETIIGPIPEHLDSGVRKNDRLQIEYGKLLYEARVTHNVELMVDIVKKSEKLDIVQKKLWYDIKSHFNIWNVSVPTSFFIRIKGPLLVLTAIKLGLPGQGSNQDEAPMDNPGSYILRMDNDTLRKIMRHLNITPPPGLIPPTESDQ